MEQKRISLNDVEWKVFEIKHLFQSLEKGKCSNEKEQTFYEKEGLPYLSATKNNNGVSNFVKQNKLYQEGNCIMFVNQGDGGAGYSAYQPYPFVSTTSNSFGYADWVNKETGLFVSCVLNKFKEKYSFGYGRTENRLKRDKIKLPIDCKGNPNWKFMEEYIKQEQKVQAQKIIDYYESKMLETAFDLVGLGDLEWKTFKFGEIFREIKRGKRLKKADHIVGNMPYVSSTRFNNGVDAFIGNQDDVRTFSDNLTVANSGSVGSSFYHCYEYIASDHVTALTLENADKNIYLFMSTIVNRLSEKYSFNREINDKRIFRETLLLPVDENGNPHWDYMSKFMENIEKEKLTKTLAYICIYELAILKEQRLDKLSEKEWKEFWLNDICKIESGIDIYERERIAGYRPYITATAQNNGLRYFVSNENKTLSRKCISVNRNGSVGYAFYHDYEALYGNDTRKLVPMYSNKYFSLFLTYIVSHQKDKYGYGYKMGTARLKRQKVMLPVNEQGAPDYQYMKEYMAIQAIKKQYDILKFYKSI